MARIKINHMYKSK